MRVKLEQLQGRNLALIYTKSFVDERSPQRIETCKPLGEAIFSHKKIRRNG